MTGELDAGGVVRRSTQADRLLRVLRDRGAQGVHTFELRGEWYIGNPSQRRRELLDRGVALANRRERLNGGASGKRWWLAELAPADAEIEGAVGIDPSGQTWFRAA